VKKTKGLRGIAGAVKEKTVGGGGESFTEKGGRQAFLEYKKQDPDSRSYGEERKVERRGGHQAI